MKIRVKNKEYEVIQILKKKLEMQDLFVCVDKNGIKTCFQRQDVFPPKKEIRNRRWTEEEVEAMKDEILSGKTDREIAEEMNFDKGFEPTMNKLRSLRKEMRDTNEYIK